MSQSAAVPVCWGWYGAVEEDEEEEEVVDGMEMMETVEVEVEVVRDVELTVGPLDETVPSTQ